ncbi:AraC family transcriptional regulator [Salinispirillum sp. LH 10-3-1]|uniref:AraC family transcriptional regulator n=1 Tax=Salinispirillum sp. LH 10-3-1 TaxID=2952525 RepID=A0AB38YDQ4_9GAMM
MAETRTVLNATDVVLPSYYLRHIIDHLRTYTVDVSAILETAGITEQMLDEPLVQLPWRRLRTVLSDGRRLTQDPHLGLLIGERLLVNMHGVLGYAAMNSSSIRQVIELLETFFPLRINLVTAHHHTQGDQFFLEIRESIDLDDVRDLVYEIIILALKNVLNYITKGTAQIALVAFPFPAGPQAALARELFKCEVSYDQQWAGMVFPLAVVDAPLSMADPDAFKHATLICQRELEKITLDDSVAQRLRRLMLEKRSGFPSLETAARLMHLTPRTLHRRLTEEGTSYRAVLEDVRHDLAVEYLRSEQISIEEIAFALGYHDVANFRRAFKRWEGVPPSAFL